MTMRSALTIILGIFLLAQSSEAAKPELTDLSVSPNPAMAGGTVYVTVSKTGPKCGVLVDYEAGTHHFSATAGTQQVEFPVSFPDPGTYTIMATGKKKGNNPRCEGGVPLWAVQVNPRPRAGKQPTPNISPIPPKPGLRENRRELKPIPVTMTPGRQGPGTQDLFGILGVDVKAYGTVADFLIRLTDGAVATITATPLGPAPNPNPVTVTARVKGRPIALTRLSPATDYSYKVIADGGGPLVSWEGTFRTQRRVVKLVVTEIHAIDDGDDTTEGDFGFSFYRDAGRSIESIVLSFSHGISTGTMVETNHSVTFPSVRENALMVYVGVGEIDGTFGISGSHFDGSKSFSLDWVRDRQSGGQQKDWSWAASAGGSNAWHVLMKGQLRVSWAD